MEASRNAYRLLMTKLERNTLLERPRQRWEDINKIDLGEIGRSGIGGIGTEKDCEQWRALVNR
jgi:hypothetical protein